jgi:cytochrome c peroxidase
MDTNQPETRIGVAVLIAAAIAVAVGAAGRHGSPVRGADRFKKDYVRPIGIPHPEDNATSPAREVLGRTLFFDPRLSGSGWISCASCHNPGLSWGDGLPRAIGHGMQPLGRRTPTILNLAWSPALFWDGRAESLEEQALGPIQAPGEMNLTLEAYPGEPIGPETVAKAIAAFERGVVSAPAPFDRWVAGEASAISPSAQRGFVLFNEKARCSVCHSGWRFTDDSFYDIGIAGDDKGRGVVTPRIQLSHFAFKTPTLRNVARRAPYMHDGSAPTLEAVMELYNRGGSVHRPSLSPEIKRLDLTGAEQEDVVAFLETLTSRDVETRVPTLPR